MKARAMEAAVLATPFAVVVLVKMLSGLGPVESEAGNQDQSQSDQSSPAVDGVNKATSAWIASLDITTDMRSPMEHGEMQQVEPIVTIEPTYRPPEFHNPLENAKLTMLMGTGTSGMASINGKLYAVGDEPAPGCRIVLIDVQERVVQIRLPSGQAFFIRPDDLRPR